MILAQNHLQQSSGNKISKREAIASLFRKHLIASIILPKG